MEKEETTKREDERERGQDYGAVVDVSIDFTICIVIPVVEHDSKDYRAADCCMQDKH